MGDENPVTPEIPAVPTDQAPVGETPTTPPVDAPGDEFKSPESKQAVLADLAKARAEARAAKEQLQAIEDANLSELEKAKKAATEAASRLAEFESANLRQRVALDKGLPASLVSRLQGTTEDEVAADADALLALIKAPRSPAPDPGQGPRPVTPDADAEYAAFAARLNLPSSRK